MIRSIFKPLLLFLSSFTLLFSCGSLEEKFGRKESSGTTVEIRNPGSGLNSEMGTLATLTGGVMVYAVNVNQPSSRGSRLLYSEQEVVSWTIPNGQYRFLAVGFANGPETGSIYCGSTAPISLSGGVVSVSLVVNTANCIASPFVPDASWVSGSFGNITLRSCSVDISSVTYGNSCTAGNILSAKISLPQYDTFSGTLDVHGNGGTIESSCITGFSSGAKVTTAKFPPGDPAVVGGDVFVLGINAYTDAACTTGKRLYGFARGMVRSTNNSVMKFETGGSPFSAGSTVYANIGSSANIVQVYLRDF